MLSSDYQKNKSSVHNFSSEIKSQILLKRVIISMLGEFYIAEFTAFFPQFSRTCIVQYMSGRGVYSQRITLYIFHKMFETSVMDEKNYFGVWRKLFCPSCRTKVSPSLINHIEFTNMIDLLSS